jgi:hypothetical protein
LTVDVRDPPGDMELFEIDELPMEIAAVAAVVAAAQTTQKTAVLNIVLLNNELNVFSQF